ncbi:MAG: penicillin acylase family protein, partial [Rhodospirillaceae bacterium]|nr:penicillin acylase family protein [Rhodospirillaceae bacterium]
ATPWAGRRFAGPELPAAGSSETLLKTAHGLTDRRHDAGYGSTARLVTDLADPDGTRVVLLGGQDGWPASTTADDQLALWQAGGWLRLPLRAETARAGAAHCTVLTP